MFGDRSLSTVLNSALQKKHYVALLNMYRNYPAFWENLGRYLSGKGKYPYRIQVRTPTGTINPTIYNYHDLLTVNEVFCRQDYFADSTISVVVDLGSNIGISALYFLTRNSQSRCYLFEPDTRNIKKLKHNLVQFESRYLLRKEAVSDSSGCFRLGIENTGRYGGIGIETGEYIDVDCLGINEVLQEILKKEEIIDILKIDTEGVEVKTVKAIEEIFLKRIRRIYLEANPKEQLHPGTFQQYQHGSICRLTNRALCS